MASKDGRRLRQLDVASFIVDPATRAAYVANRDDILQNVRSLLLVDPLVTSTAVRVFDCSAKYCGAALILPIDERELRPEEIGYISAKANKSLEIGGSSYLLNGLFTIVDGKPMKAEISDQVKERRGSHVEQIAIYIVNKLNSNSVINKWPLLPDDHINQMLKLDIKYYSSQAEGVEKADALFVQTLLQKCCTQRLIDKIASAEKWPRERTLEHAIKCGPEAVWRMVLMQSEPSERVKLDVARVILDQQFISKDSDWENLLLRLRRAMEVTGDAESDIVNKIIGRWASSKCRVLAAVYQRNFHDGAKSLSELNDLIVSCRAAQEPILDAEAKTLVQGLNGRDPSLENLKSLSLKDNKINSSTCFSSSSFPESKVLSVREDLVSSEVSVNGDGQVLGTETPHHSQRSYPSHRGDWSYQSFHNWGQKCSYEEGHHYWPSRPAYFYGNIAHWQSPSGFSHSDFRDHMIYGPRQPQHNWSQSHPYSDSAYLPEAGNTLFPSEYIGKAPEKG